MNSGLPLQSASQKRVSIYNLSIIQGLIQDFGNGGGVGGQGNFCLLKCTHSRAIA